MFVWGSNDYYAPTFKNPLRYLTEPGRRAASHSGQLPWEDLGRAFTERGLARPHPRRAPTIEIRGIRLGFRGTDDAHLGRDHYARSPARSTAPTVDVAIGVTHAPVPPGARRDDRTTATT